MILLINEEHDVDKLDSFQELTLIEQEQLISWCNSSFKKIQRINRGHTSYGLKHKFEHSKDGFYITNGAFKKAMLEAGFDYKPSHSVDKNWCFNVSEESVTLLDGKSK